MIESVGIQCIEYPISGLIQRDDLLTRSSCYSIGSDESSISIIDVGLGSISEYITRIIVGVGRNEYTGSCIDGLNYILRNKDMILSIINFFS
ncbi:hypothetical protein HOO68_00005 [Candidatus Gracilibacteria bacterium]|nr:hypothetical protein [Candidatus Gracilibacteria bacterium]